MNPSIIFTCVPRLLTTSGKILQLDGPLNFPSFCSDYFKTSPTPWPLLISPLTTAYFLLGNHIDFFFFFCSTEKIEARARSASNYYHQIPNLLSSTILIPSLLCSFYNGTSISSSKRQALHLCFFNPYHLQRKNLVLEQGFSSLHLLDYLQVVCKNPYCWAPLLEFLIQLV